MPFPFNKYLPLSVAVTWQFEVLQQNQHIFLPFSQFTDERFILPVDVSNLSFFLLSKFYIFT